MDRGSDVDDIWQLEKDQYDDQFNHLVVIDKTTEKIVGTYRLQTYEQAINGLGFTTNHRFHVDQFPAELLENAVEIGRACIDKDHRNGMVLYLLWKGLAAYLQTYGKEHLFGYAALDSYNPYTASRTFQYLKQNHYLHHDIWIDRREGFIHPVHWPNDDHEPDVNLPLLLKNYLNVGARICGGPTFDLKHQLVHFLILLDIKAMPNRIREMVWNKAVPEKPEE
jgi:putative hemolysin